MQITIATLNQGKLREIRALLNEPQFEILGVEKEFVFPEETGDTYLENAMIKATWNGQPVELNLIPSGATEDLTNFEIFIKG